METEKDMTPILLEDLGRLPTKEGSKYKRRFGIYECQFCGTKWKACTDDMKLGKIKSCGCIRGKGSATHGESKTKLYKTWCNIKNRCLNENTPDYSYYGALGITICDEWKDKYISFRDWALDNGYADELTIDRIDVTKNYEPSNCRWVTREIQARNTRVIRKDNTSGYRGVTYKKSQKRYIARISLGGRMFYIGYFKTPLEASYAYDLFVYYHNLEHTTNHPKESYTEEQLSQPQKPLPISKNKSQE